MCPFQTTKSSDRPPEASERLSQTVIEAVAAAEDCDATDLPVLFDHLDPDALDSLFGTRGRSDPEAPQGSVCFSYCGYEVHAYADGRVTLDPLQA